MNVNKTNLLNVCKANLMFLNPAEKDTSEQKIRIKK